MMASEVNQKLTTNRTYTLMPIGMGSLTERVVWSIINMSSVITASLIQNSQIAHRYLFLLSVFLKFYISCILISQIISRINHFLDK